MSYKVSFIVQSEFLVITGGRNFTGTLLLAWPSPWSCLHCGVGPCNCCATVSTMTTPRQQRGRRSGNWKGAGAV